MASVPEMLAQFSGIEHPPAGKDQVGRTAREQLHGVALPLTREGGGQSTAFEQTLLMCSLGSWDGRSLGSWDGRSLGSWDVKSFALSLTRRGSSTAFEQPLCNLGG